MYRILLIFVFSISNLVFAEDQLQIMFDMFQQKKYENALPIIEQLLKDQPTNPDLLFNAGLIEYHLNNFGKALAFWRKAKNLDHFHAPAQKAQHFLETSLKLSNQRTIYHRILDALPTDIVLGLLAALLVTCGWKWISWLGRKKHNTQSNEGPTFVLYFITSVFFLCLLATFGKLYVDSFSVGTIIGKKVEARIAPGRDQLSLFETVEGEEVYIKQKLQNGDGTEWMQIYQLNGSRGWIPAADIMQTSGRSL